MAEEKIKSEMAKRGKRSMGDDFQDMAHDKYVMLLNDRIVDGHHFLALAKALNISSSLRALDLTPLRFQEKRGSVLDLIRQKYGQNNNRRQGGAFAARHPRIPVLHRRQRAG